MRRFSAPKGIESIATRHVGDVLNFQLQIGFSAPKGIESIATREQCPLRTGREC